MLMQLIFFPIKAYEHFFSYNKLIMTLIQEKPIVLVALTGGIESAVAAYLLKKQGHRCIGIAVQLFDQKEMAGPFSDIAVLDFDKILKLCQFLDIPFYVVNASAHFNYLVADPVVGRVLSGKTFEPLPYLNLVVINALLEKMHKFKAQFIATAHYAKILKNQRTGENEIWVANDLENDQSYLLSRLTSIHLEKLILPLSEMRKKEVLKVGELIKVDLVNRVKSQNQIIMHDPRMIDFVEARSSKDLRKPGSIFEYYKEVTICDHLGIHHFYLGKNHLEIKERPELKIDTAIEVLQIVPFKGKVFVDNPKRLKYRHLNISQLYFYNTVDTSTPMKCYVKLLPNSEKLSCYLYFKNNQMALVDFEHTYSGQVTPGQLVVFYNRGFEKAKILASGMVEASGVFNTEGYNTLPNNKLSEKDELEQQGPDDEREQIEF